MTSKPYIYALKGIAALFGYLWAALMAFIVIGTLCWSKDPSFDLWFLVLVGALCLTYAVLYTRDILRGK